MAEYLIQDTTLGDIADAIRAKTGGSSAMTPAEMVTEIGTIQTGIIPTGTKQISIAQNGTTTEDVTNYANAEITVNVPPDISAALQALGFTIVSDTIITGTRSNGNTSGVFSDTGTTNGQGLIVVALDTPTVNQAVIRLEGNGNSQSCAVYRYPHDVKHGIGTNVNGFLQNGIRYRAIIYTP